MYSPALARALSRSLSHVHVLHTGQAMERQNREEPASDEYTYSALKKKISMLTSVAQELERWESAGTSAEAAASLDLLLDSSESEGEGQCAT